MKMCIFVLTLSIYTGHSMNLGTKLRIEKSENCSGELLNFGKIKQLKEKHYYVIPQTLDGDAPKEFIGAYLYYEESGYTKSNVKSWPKYIAKTAEKWYPIESVTEYVINKLGEVLGLKMNETELVVCNSQVRFLSKFFLHKNEILLHGAEICGDYLNDRNLAREIADNKTDAREMFTFEFICKALDKVFKSHASKLKEELVRMLVFDCLMGNNDRHFYNWGVIINTQRDIKQPVFAPLYDSARGLFWNDSDEKIKSNYIKWKEAGNSKMIKYSNNSMPRISIEDKKNANHFDLIEYIIKEDSNYKEIVRSLSSKEMEKKVINKLRTEYSQFFIKERQLMIEELLEYRFNKTRELAL